jgi:hypothetical protein
MTTETGPFYPTPDTVNTTDPLATAALGLTKIGIPPQALDIKRLHSVEEALRHQIIKIENNDFSGMELLLTCQAQMLHQLFTRSAEKYAASDMPDATRPYGNIALKAQSYCRMTVNTLTQMKHGLSRKKSRNELISDEF